MINWNNNRSAFIELCFCDDLQSEYKQYIANEPNKMQLFRVENNQLVHRKWIPSKYCCYSNDELTKDFIDIIIGYWQPNIWKPIRKDLLLEAKNLEVLFCQKIDQNCNDCGYLVRNTNSCLVDNKSLNIHALMACNNECFKHRKEMI